MAESVDAARKDLSELMLKTQIEATRVTCQRFAETIAERDDGVANRLLLLGKRLQEIEDPAESATSLIEASEVVVNAEPAASTSRMLSSASSDAPNPRSV